jgi:ribosomal protein S18 acetylase RimI-like enzyme
MVHNFHISTGGIEVLDSIKELWEKLNTHHRDRAPHFSAMFARKTFAERKEDILAHAAGGLCVVLARDNEGTLIGYCVNTINDRHVGEIDSLFILAEYRGQGLGEILVANSVRWLNEEGVSRIFLEVSAGNEQVFDFYAKFGFFPAKIILEQHPRQIDRGTRKGGASNGSSFS